ncbi:MAG TPA: S8 family serine peptidase [Candidatus Eisenbacteria bacterium]
MSSHDPHHSRRRHTSGAPLALLALSLVAASCSRTPITAPASSAPAGRGSPGALPHSLSTSETIGDIDGQFVLALAPGTDAAQIAAQLGATLLDVQEGIAVFQRPAGDPIDVEVDTKNDPGVLSSEDNTLAMPAEARQKSWAFDDGLGSYSACVGQPASYSLGLSAAHAVSQGAGVLVAVLDTGIDPTHPLFAGRIAGGWDFVDNDADPTDVRTGLDLNGDGVPDGSYGHGTHVAGIVALTAPRAQLLIVRVLDSEGRGDVKSVAAGIRWATANGARVINLSLGMLRASNAVGIAIAEARMRGVVCVAAAGNDGAASPQEYPASNNQTIAVAASDPTGTPTSWTSYGSFVDLCAPGVAIRSAYPGGGYVLWSGTSMSAPFVAGTAALLLSLHPDWGLDQVMTRVRASVRPLIGASLAQAGGLGTGILDVRGSLQDDIQPIDVTDQQADPSAGSTTP